MVTPPVSAMSLNAANDAFNEDDLIIRKAISLLEQRMFKRGPAFQNPEDVEQYLRLQLGGEKREVFACVFLDSKHRLIAIESLFFGTIDVTSVHPRVILQRALELNSAALIMAHNHPSGDTNPSVVDGALTRHLQEILAKVDIRLLDHFIIGEGKPYSFASAGLL